MWSSLTWPTIDFQVLICYSRWRMGSQWMVQWWSDRPHWFQPWILAMNGKGAKVPRSSENEKKNHGPMNIMNHWTIPSRMILQVLPRKLTNVPWKSLVGSDVFPIVSIVPLKRRHSLSFRGCICVCVFPQPQGSFLGYTAHSTNPTNRTAPQHLLLDFQQHLHCRIRRWHWRPRRRGGGWWDLRKLTQILVTKFATFRFLKKLQFCTLPGKCTLLNPKSWESWESWRFGSDDVPSFFFLGDF